ncbi:isopenicillin N synthase family dioxygenase [Salipiger mangrovisoli]|uniref:2-oxoglutarate-dependent ethylene/succinate-forming enzyme n=1 Tax=Salipiger mangrovisoli TaxID=2865933 RepID=A0ABR9WWK3_9RHOB|nr:isopenicillin N synthase family oxygenase [Salipiger mangrovisoli]MBE9635661.1 isopenicillin N synthase family oxygenase [Salipiger mangrovisoli]
MIPVLDFEDLDDDPEGFAFALGQACREDGFFLLANPPIPEALMARVFAASEAFFALPESRKAQLGISSNARNRGWAGLGSEQQDGASHPDRKEAFNIGLDLPANDPRVLAGEPFRGPNLWPDLPDFRDAMLAYYAAAMALGIKLHEAVAMDLGVPQGFFAQHFTEPMATLRLLHYPPGTGATDERGASAHTDYGALTLLATDGEPGLQVRPRGGHWMDVPQLPGALIVNIGDCLMRWTNDIYVSTTHRVLPPVRTRHSVAFFLDPNPESLIAALPGTGTPVYPPVRAVDYLRWRLESTEPEAEQAESGAAEIPAHQAGQAAGAAP